MAQIDHFNILNSKLLSLKQPRHMTGPSIVADHRIVTPLRAHGMTPTFLDIDLVKVLFNALVMLAHGAILGIGNVVIASVVPDVEVFDEVK